MKQLMPLFLVIFLFSQLSCKLSPKPTSNSNELDFDIAKIEVQMSEESIVWTKTVDGREIVDGRERVQLFMDSGLQINLMLDIDRSSDPHGTFCLSDKLSSKIIFQMVSSELKEDETVKWGCIEEYLHPDDAKLRKEEIDKHHETTNLFMEHCYVNKDLVLILSRDLPLDQVKKFESIFMKEPNTD
jgi:hypothetical protein